MMNEALLDVNLLIASVVENHADHERAARHFLSSLEDSRPSAAELLTINPSTLVSRIRKLGLKKLK